MREIFYHAISNVGVSINMKWLYFCFVLSFLASYVVAANEVYKAVENADFAKLKQLFADGANLNEPMQCMIDEEEYYSATPISKAIEMKSPKLVKFLLENGALCSEGFGAKIAIHGSNEVTFCSSPLEMAISSNNHEILMMLLQYSSGLQSSDCDSEESSPHPKKSRLSGSSLSSALLDCDNIQQTIILLFYGADPYLQVDDGSGSPMEEAVKNKDYLTIALYMFRHRLNGLQRATAENLESVISGLPWLQINSVMAILSYQLPTVSLPLQLQLLFP